MSLDATSFPRPAHGAVDALLFGLHPSKVESVAWIGSSCVGRAGRVFFFATLIAFFEVAGEVARGRD